LVEVRRKRREEGGGGRRREEEGGGGRRREEEGGGRRREEEGVGRTLPRQESLGPIIILIEGNPHLKKEEQEGEGIEEGGGRIGGWRELAYRLLYFLFGESWCAGDFFFVTLFFSCLTQVLGLE
jgi:hypothetical protein